jgi:hypothetical protein
MRYLRYSAIRVREYHRALHSLDYLACLTRREFKRMYYDGRTALRSIPLPVIPTLLEQHRPGLTPELVLANRRTLMAKMQAEIDWGRKRQGLCLMCGKKHTQDFACLSTD